MTDILRVLALIVVPVVFGVGVELVLHWWQKGGRRRQKARRGKKKRKQEPASADDWVI